MTCVFCAIVEGVEDASVVYEDERVVAFMDIQPITRGHVLVVPRRHAAGLADLDDADGDAILRAARRTAAALRRSELRCEGVNLFVADGAAAGQEVFHVHMHVLPRHGDDGFALRLPPDHAMRPRDELDDAAATIRGAWA